MGNAPVTLGIKLDNEDGKPSATTAGGTVSGFVFADMPQKHKAKSLILEVRGDETAKIHHIGGSKNAQRPLIFVALKLREFEDQRVRKGRYEFPFCFDLPATLPSSTRVNKGSKSWCQVKYTIRATLVGLRPGTNTVSLLPLFVVSAPIPPDPVPFMVEPVTSKIKNAVGMNKGSITFGVRVADTRIGRGDELELEIACRNDTTIDIERVQVKVKEICEWKVDTSTESVEATLATIPNLSIPGGLDKKEKSEIKESKKAGTDPHQEHFLDIFSEITSKLNVVKLKIPETARSTYKGQTIHIKHIMTAKIKMGRGLDDPQVEIPLRIGSPAIAEARIPSEKLPPPVPLPPPPPTDEEMPAAVSMPLGWSGAEQSLRVIAPPSAIKMGGSAALTSENGTEVPPLPVPIAVPPPSLSLDHLFTEMVASLDDYDIISAKLEDPDWKQLFVTLDPEGFGSVISHINHDFDQPRIAALIAPVINDGKFSCAHCAAALKSSETWNRIAVAQRLLPFCSDLASGADSIRAEITEWENVVLHDDFARAKMSTAPSSQEDALEKDPSMVKNLEAVRLF